MKTILLLIIALIYIKVTAQNLVNNGNFKILINPSSSQSNKTIEVYNSLGVLVYTNNLTCNYNQEIEIKLSDLPDGIYLLKQLTNGKQEIELFNIVK